MRKENFYENNFSKVKLKSRQIILLSVLVLFAAVAEMILPSLLAKFNISYAKMFWLFILGSLLGVVLEGVFCLIRYGCWETHVVSIWGPFCILYGFGAVGFYLCHARLYYKKWWIQFLIYCTIGFCIELICGCLLEFGLHMRAWDYSSHFMNIRGHVSLKMTIVRGMAKDGKYAALYNSQFA